MLNVALCVLLLVKVSAMRDGQKVTEEPGLFSSWVCFLTLHNETEPFITAVIVHESFVLTAGGKVKPYFASRQFSLIHVNQQFIRRQST